MHQFPFSPAASPTGLIAQPGSALRTYAALAAVIGWAALRSQLWITLGIVVGQGRGFAMGLVIYTGVFTVLTNMLAALVLSACAVGRVLWLTRG